MMVQVTAASLVAENRVLAHPASTGSITTSGNKEDFVSMGMTSRAANCSGWSAIRARCWPSRRLPRRARWICWPRSRPGSYWKKHGGKIRSVSPPIEGDRPYYRDIAALEKLIAGGGLRV